MVYSIISEGKMIPPGLFRFFHAGCRTGTMTGRTMTSWRLNQNSCMRTSPVSYYKNAHYNNVGRAVGASFSALNSVSVPYDAAD